MKRRRYHDRFLPHASVQTRRRRHSGDAGQEAQGECWMRWSGGREGYGTLEGQTRGPLSYGDAIQQSALLPI